MTVKEMGPAGQCILAGPFLFPISKERGSAKNRPALSGRRARTLSPSRVPLDQVPRTPSRRAGRGPNRERSWSCLSWNMQIAPAPLHLSGRAASFRRHGGQGFAQRRERSGDMLRVP